MFVIALRSPQRHHDSRGKEDVVTRPLWKKGGLAAIAAKGRDLFLRDGWGCQEGNEVTDGITGSPRGWENEEEREGLR